MAGFVTGWIPECNFQLFWVLGFRSLAIVIDGILSVKTCIADAAQFEE